MTNDGQDVGVRDHGFKFPIGKPVRLVVGGELKAGHWLQLGSRPKENLRWTVNLQRLELCSGGIQRTYVCRGVVHGGSTIPDPDKWFHEHELVACEPFPCEEEKKADG